jgi:hypothetical protein
MKWRILGPVIGVGAGYGIAKLCEVMARANVKVRPGLAHVEWWEALLAGHLSDWLFYHYPEQMAIVTLIALAAFGFIIGWWLES